MGTLTCLLGVSLKMYFGLEQTCQWLKQVAQIAPLPRGLELFVLPSFPALPDAQRILRGTGIGYGGQDVWYDVKGPFTGEVSAAMLRELGCRYVAVGHAERRRLFGETDAIVASKTAAAARAGLLPVVCVGEKQRYEGPEYAARFVERQLRASLLGVPDTQLVIAYEPVWAIGASDAAPPHLVRTVTASIKACLAERRAMSWVLYGGAAGPGTLASLANGARNMSPDGLFLGRSVHRPEDLSRVVEEAAAIQLSRRRVAEKDNPRFPSDCASSSGSEDTPEQTKR